MYNSSKLDPPRGNDVVRAQAEWEQEKKNIAEQNEYLSSFNKESDRDLALLLSIDEIKSIMQNKISAFTGNSGVGKTHLLLAVKNHAGKKFPNKKIEYTMGRSSDSVDAPNPDILTGARDALDIIAAGGSQFFMMVEGGKIDYAAHRDDAATMIHEVLDFNAAIAEAYEFYKKHKDETLIIVTADHETGGLVLGYKGDYSLSLKELKSQKVSIDRLKAILRSQGDTTWGNIAKIVKENTGVEIRDSYIAEETVSMTSDLANKLAWEAIYDLDRKAAVSWASGNHSGTFVPLFAIGEEADEFHGVIDNTDIPKIIKRVANLDKKKNRKR